MSELDLTRAEIERAAQRLRGSLVRTPLIGAIRLPGQRSRPTLRVKADLLQPSGSSWYRGAAHAGSRALGSWKGLVVCGDDPLACAWHEVAAAQRLPRLAVVTRAQRVALAEAVASEELEWLEVTESAAEAASAAGRARGYRLAPGPTDREVVLGIATLALELVADLPAECERVVVGVAALVAPLRAAFAALTSGVRVEEAGTSGSGLSEAARRGLRLELGPSSLRALATALSLPAHVTACALLAE